MNLKKIAEATYASQNKFELWQLLEALSQLKIKNILEIGVHRGGMIDTLRGVYPKATIVGVDNDFSFLRAVDFIKVEADSHHMETREIVAGHFNGPVDFLFIDGDHSFDGAMIDFELYRTLVKPGGVIGFHDIMRDPENVPHHAGVDCRKLFDVIKRNYPSIEIWDGTIGMDAPGIGLVFV